VLVIPYTWFSQASFSLGDVIFKRLDLARRKIRIIFVLLVINDLTGIDSGWSAVLLIGNGLIDWYSDVQLISGLHESRSAVAASEGVRVVIHPPDTPPFPLTEGFDVPSGYSASFGVRPRRNVRIGQPHGKCSRSNPFDLKLPAAADDSARGETSVDRSSSDAETINEFGDVNVSPRRHRYRAITCQKMCLQSHVVAQCHCYDTSLPILPELRRPQRSSSPTDYYGYYETGSEEIKPCRMNEELNDTCIDNATDECLTAIVTMYHRIQCARRTRDMVTRNTTLMAQCGCHPPCDEFQYDVSYSLSKWPATGFEGDSAFFEIFHVEKFHDRFNVPPARRARSSSQWNDTSATRRAGNP
jgi:hypothetical protein